MPINRAPYNALIDDDGSGLTGSIWNKAAIKNVLLDPIDAMASGWSVIPFNAAHYSGDVGTVVATASIFAVCYLGAYTYAVQLYVSGNITAGAPNLIKVALPVTPTQPAIGVQNAALNGTYEMGATLCNAGQAFMYIRRANTAPFAVGSFAINAAIIVAIG